MKKFTASFILFLMMYNLFGYYITYLYLKNDNSEKIAENFSTNPNFPYTKIKFKLAGDLIVDKEYVRIDDKEFMYKNKMYDIYKKEYKDGYVIFYCVNDKKEDDIRKNMFAHLEKNRPMGKKPFDFANYKIKKCNTTEFTLSNFFDEKKVIYYLPEINFPNSFRRIEIPPPRNFSI